MLIYHQFKNNNVEYFIIDKFTKTDPYFLGNVYVTLEDFDDDDSTHLCKYMDCSNCSISSLCVANGSKRLQEAIKLYPSLLTNFPELGV
jgi:hypothetical protein